MGPGADFIFWNSGGDLDGAGGAAVDVVRAEFSGAADFCGLCGVFAWMVAELQRASVDAGGKCAAGVFVSRVGGGKRETENSDGVWAIFESGGDTAAAAESETGGTEEDGYRGFTTISEKLDAQELAVFLNQYLSDMTSLVFENHGTLDKYIGDAVMAFWGAPFEDEKHAAHGCNSALRMMQRVREMQRVWEAGGKPKLDIGIGLNSGVASVGNMGSVLRYGYTALGDTVNLSSRLEGLNKDYGTHIIVNETTYAATRKANFVYRELDVIRVKGKMQPVTIYELIGRRGEASDYGNAEDVRMRLSEFSRGRELYHARRWEDAQKIFQAILDKRGEDGPSRMYWKRCQEYLFDEPPLGWDGVFTMTHK